MRLDKQHYFYLFVGFLFLGIVSVNLFSDGMFVDGLVYADIARNMAEGLGSFWKPHYSLSLYNEFYEHPPLAFGLQSIGFVLFGDSIYVERFYSLFTFIITAYLIVQIWAKLTHDKKTGWIPLFFWIIVTSITWSAANNMLENTMNIFVCLSVLLYFKSFDKKRILWVILSGISLSLGILTKGFFCLYIWGVPFFIWLFMRERNFLSMLVDTAIMIVSSLFPLALIYMLVPAAQNNMLQYFNNQVLDSIQNEKTVDTRFAILRMFFENIIAPLIIAIIILLVALKKKVQKKYFKENLMGALMFLGIVFSGILPIMISMKQSGFYILTVYPLFAIGLSYYLYPIIKPVIDNLRTNTLGFKIFKGLTIGIIIISIGLSIGQINKVGENKAMIYDIKAVINVVGKNSIINICPNMYEIWSLHGYFSRYGNVSLDKNQMNIYQYYLSLDNCNEKYLEKNYDLVSLETKKYKLYKLKKNNHR